MKGLFRKDLIFIKKQLRFFAIFVVIMMIPIVMNLCFGFPEETFSKGFIVGYIVILAGITSLSSISYDEANKGMLFIMSMPVSRKEYVVSKYLIAIFISVFYTLVIAISIIIYDLSGGENVKIVDVIGLYICCFSTALTIFSVGAPVYFRYGGGKGILALLSTIAILYVVIIASLKMAKKFNMDYEIILQNITENDLLLLSGLMFAVGIIAMMISYALSLKIVKAKEF